MKTYFKSLLSVSLLGIALFASHTFAADCTESQQYPGYFACLEYDVCNNPGGTCRCNEGSTISHNSRCLGTSNGNYIKVIDSPAYAGFSEFVFSFKVTNKSTSTKTFVVDFPNVSTKGIKVINASADGLINGGLISLNGLTDPKYSIGAGETKTIVITGTIYSDDGTFTSLATRAYITQSSVTSSIDSISIETLPMADFSLTGSLGTAIPLFSGDEISYIYTIKNIGSTTATEGIFTYYLSSLLGGTAGIGNAISDLAPGASQTFTITKPLLSTPSIGTVLISTGIVSAGREISNVNNTAVIEYTVPRFVDLSFGDIVKTSPNPEDSGDVISFTVNYKNHGNETANGLRLVTNISGTTLSQTYNLPDLAMESSGSIIISTVIPTDYPIGTNFCLSGYIAGSNESESTSNNQITPVCYTFVRHADVVISAKLLTDLSSVGLGGILTYEITVSNTGERIATGVNITTELSNGLSVINNGYWTGISLDSGDTKILQLQARVTSLPLTGMDITFTGNAIFNGKEDNKSNNSVSLTHHLDGLSDVYVQHTMSPFSGFRQGDSVFYTIVYGNSGARAAQNVQLAISLPSILQSSTTTWNLGTLAAGQTGTLVVNTSLLSFLSAGTTFSSQATITTTTPQTSTGNDISTLSSTIQATDYFSLNLTVQNISKPALNITNKSISAVSGDTVVFTVNYANNGNIDGTNATVRFDNLGRVALGGFISSLGTLTVNQQGSFTVTGIIIGTNFDAFSPTTTLNFNGTGISDSVTISEPNVCGDGLVTKNEECDGSVGTGQSCEQCRIVTNQIVNTACFEFTNGRRKCTSATLDIKKPMCGSLEVSKVKGENNQVRAICLGQYSANAPMTIDCGNGTTYSGTGDSHGNFTQICQYSSSSRASNARISCSVGTDINNSDCVRSALSCDLDADTEIAIIDEDDERGEVEYTCQTENDEEANLTIDCGNGDTFEDVGSEISYTCHYDENDYEDLDDNKTIEAKCLINNNTACTNDDVTLDYGILGICGNGIREGYEQCDEGGDRGERNGGLCKRGCILNDEASSCLSISNANVSLQNNEYLPFWWRLTSTKNIVKDTSCSSKYENMIDEKSMQCTFSMKQPGKDAEQVFSVACNEKMLNNALFSTYYKNYWDVAFGNYYINLKQIFDDNSQFDNDLFGEYKIRLDRVDYRYCAYDEDEDDYERKDTELDNVCETNFTVTKPYLVQKSAFGLTPKATTINLDDFYDINGDKLIKRTDLEDVMILDSNDYKISNITNLTKTFLDKYNKLAIANKYLPKQLQGLNVSKAAGVANKSMYVIDRGNSSQTSITIDGKTWNQSPFTIITYGLNVIIKGNVDVNGMFIVNNGNIIFEPEDCNQQQTVKGIFIVNNGSFNSRKSSNQASIVNNSLNDPRCNAGGLYVKGVLIGNGIETLVSQRRASLPTWFYVNGSEKSIQVQRRNQILNGAAVVIEYSPDLWVQLPPGAEEFTSTLDVYKK